MIYGAECLNSRRRMDEHFGWSLQNLVCLLPCILAEAVAALARPACLALLLGASRIAGKPSGVLWNVDPSRSGLEESSQSCGTDLAL